jgi:Zn-dependent peptidase ImmA (M78 family)
MSHIKNLQIEKEANYFAMCLLMPAHLVKQEVAKLTIDLTDDTAIKSLAKTFDVSMTAMALRLSQLKVLKP